MKKPKISFSKKGAMINILWILVENPNNRYRMIFCSVPKRQVALFKEAMAEMPGRMLLLGYDDYSEYWTEMLVSLGDSEIMATQT